MHSIRREASTATIAVLAFFVAWLTFCLPVPAIAQGITSVQMAFGNPDGAMAAASNREHYLIQRSQYSLSYNDALRYPNWVQWHLSKADIGTEERGAFYPDRGLPIGFTRVTPSDYSNQGFDRGHMCPSKDRSANRADNDAVFSMANIVPQLHPLNAGPWERLEQYCRDQASAGNDLFIICGSIAPPAATNRNKAPLFPRIGRAQISVPVACWKVIAIVPPGSGLDKRGAFSNDPVARLPSARIIAVLMPNDSTVTLRTDWHRYVVPIATIEQRTGYRFTAQLTRQ